MYSSSASHTYIYISSMLLHLMDEITSVIEYLLGIYNTWMPLPTEPNPDAVHALHQQHQNRQVKPPPWLRAQLVAFHAPPEARRPWHLP